jgi:hypothetical protein
MAWRQCPKRLWLEVRRPELAVYPPATRRSFAMGHEVGAVARTLQAGGVLIHPPTLGAALRDTARLLAGRGDLTLFEATFSHGGVLVRADVLRREAGVARMVEVKSATEVRRHHVDDAAVQAWVVRGAGVPLEGVALACIDREFVYHGDGDYRGLLRETDVSARVDELGPRIPEWIAGCAATLAGDLPAREVSEACSRPFACPFVGTCTGDEPRDVTPPREFDRRPAADLAGLSFPRFYLGVETVRSAVPVWAGTRPWEPVPFQWSCHVERAAGELEHREFIDTSGDAPMRAFAETVVATLGTEGPVLVYGAAGRGVLAALGARYADLREQLRSIDARLVDLLPLVRSVWHTPGASEPGSLDDLLLTVAPELDPADLGEVRGDGDLQTAYGEAARPDTSPERADEIASSLLAFGARGTLGLARLRRFLAGENGPSLPV